MSRTTIIELSRTKSKRQMTLNSEWSNIMNENIIIPSGSVIQLKQAFIDEGAPFPDGAIELDNDVDISMSFIYWLVDQNLGQPYYSSINPADQGKGGIFIACKYTYGGVPALGDTLEGSASFTIPKGIYSPDDLAQYISNNMSNLNISVSINNLPPYTSANVNTFLQSSVDGVHVYNCSADNPGLVEGIYILGVTITPDLIAQFTKGMQMYVSHDDEHGNFVPYVLVTISATLGTFTYNEVDFVPGIDGRSAGSSWRCYPVLKNHTNIGFYLAGKKAINKYFWYGLENTWYGASQASLIYLNNRFQFNFLHSPHFIDADGTIGITIDNRNLGNTVITANSGIAFTSLQPVEFWRDTLGFDLGGVVRSVADYENFNPPNNESIMQFGVNITGALVGNYALPAQDIAKGMVVQDNLYYVTTSQTDAIIAVTANSGTSTQKNSGYYYIDINGLESSKMYNELRTDLNISGVVSRYRSANGIITSYTESAAQFFVELPIILSGFDVRILLPDYTPALTLGSSSAVFIEIISPIEQNEEQNEEQPPEE